MTESRVGLVVLFFWSFGEQYSCFLLSLILVGFNFSSFFSFFSLSLGCVLMEDLTRHGIVYLCPKGKVMIYVSKKIGAPKNIS